MIIITPNPQTQGSEISNLALKGKKKTETPKTFPKNSSIKWIQQCNLPKFICSLQLSIKTQGRGKKINKKKKRKRKDRKRFLKTKALETRKARHKEKGKSTWVEASSMDSSDVFGRVNPWSQEVNVHDGVVSPAKWVDGDRLERGGEIPVSELVNGWEAFCHQSTGGDNQSGVAEDTPWWVWLISEAFPVTQKAIAWMIDTCNSRENYI